MPSKQCDFSGWATKNDLKCSDGRTIRRNAFKDNDGTRVPLVWNHQHNDPDNVLGHAILENREDGVYAYGFFNDTEKAANAKEAVKHGDIVAMSIYANKLKQSGGDVLHGVIREVSLVLAGANPGAYIDAVLTHSDDAYSDGIIYTGENISVMSTELNHAEESDKTLETKKPENDSEETVQDVFDSLTEKQKTVVYAIIGQALEGNEPANSTALHSDVAHADDEENGETVQDVFDSLTEKQKTVVYAIIGKALEESDNNNKSDEESEGGNDNMKHNVFDSATENYENNDVLSHAEMSEIIKDSKRCGSMREAVLQHGIEDIEYLFPDAKTMTNAPTFIQREQEWVSIVMNGVHHTPFSRVKSVFADITEDEARAKGYIKGKMKKEEVFSLLKRSTDPQTIYKKQKLHRDDVIDITDFDVVAWLKTEMRMMLNEEIARAVLIGDGRVAGDDKIEETHIRPIANDDALYTIQAPVQVASNATEDDKAKAVIRKIIKARKDYKGSGNPVLFTTEDFLTDMLLLTDNEGRDLYEDEAKLAKKLRVSKIVTVPVMEGATGKTGGDLVAILVNLNDYNVGADKGGAVNMFDDFDIDYNAQKYLIETRCSGALTKPYSAIAVEVTVA